jgi:hypothetical protein
MKLVYESYIHKYLLLKLTIKEISIVYYLYETDKYFNKIVEELVYNEDEDDFYIFVKNRKTDFDKIKNWLEYAFSHEFLKKEMRKWKIKQIMTR